MGSRSGSLRLMYLRAGYPFRQLDVLLTFGDTLRKRRIMAHIITYPMPPHSDHVFATKHGVDLRLRIFAKEDGPRGAPWLLFIHGGAFTTGQHWYPFPLYLHGFPSIGLHVVSISYRLLPHASLDDMLEDCRDALVWTRQHLPDHAPGVDIDRWVIAGASAGGSLAQIIAGTTDHKPRCFVNVYGAGNFGESTEGGVAGTAPSTRRAEPNFNGNYSLEALEKYRMSRDLTQARVFCPNFLTTPANRLNQGWDTDQVTFDETLILHLDTRHHMTQRGLLIKTLLRRELFTDEASWRNRVRTSSPISYLSNSYPPTVFLHGEDDSVVPVQNSKEAATILRNNGVEVLEVYEPGAEHGFDRKYEVCFLLKVPRWPSLSDHRIRTFRYTTNISSLFWTSCRVIFSLRSTQKASEGESITATMHTVFDETCTRLSEIHVGLRAAMSSMLSSGR